MARSFNSLAPVLITFSCFLCLLGCYYVISSSSQASSDGFLGCLTDNNVPVFTQSSHFFMPLLNASIRNPKFFVNTTVRPLYIVMPTTTPHVQAAVRCGSGNNMSIRVRSGGHDYEGLSYRSVDAGGFAMLDMSELRTIVVDNQTSTAWVESGATLGELYYKIGNDSNMLGFPAGVCPTVGIGGHFSGGGFGMMMRKYGLSIDNIINAELVDAKGRLLNKTTMGEDVFWAIRGGGGGSFGVVVKWQVTLIPVPPSVTVFNVSVSLGQGAVDVVTKWQQVAPTMPRDLFIRVLIKNKRADFQALFLGTCEALLPVMNKNFPELRFNRSDCREMTWLQSAPYIYLGKDSSVEDLLKRNTSTFFSTYGFKATTDYVREEKPIPRDVWAGIFHKLAQPEARDARVILDPYGGFMSDVPDSATPFPHRAGVLYSIQFYNYWPVYRESGEMQINWIKDVYAFMAPYVSSNPREAYFNCRDLDLGTNWGAKYFMGNYQKLTKAKGEIDPLEYFRNEQSIPLQGNITKMRASPDDDAEAGDGGSASSY
ncbi:berberine bridge enzyme-like Cyn d 4 [Hordeum vulgare subsp. vulgare]|uniref:FAD-binding PCMH-type domain-containing protein n=1 Tax=Hordeum vulgare subsp. vulgare TaxID=112509 RepID=A0A8I6XAW5_HORVV|nr:berberine bridge enzyme-like Cyn d 4 [Hordeum vulgare subsp. vulgare]